ncbi:MAG: hypothetical protein Q7T55_15775 [Solirubrobacteraceae bacterium]|nr:hypothetical protein [Solirubrobacteraceae bacterium]
MGEAEHPRPVAEAASARLDVRIEPRGPAAERGIAKLVASGVAARDLEAELGAPAATATGLTDGEAVIGLLVEAAALALDDTDLHLTIQRR